MNITSVFIVLSIKGPDYEIIDIATSFVDATKFYVDRQNKILPDQALGLWKFTYNVSAGKTQYLSKQVYFFSDGLLGELIVSTNSEYSPYLDPSL